MTIDKQTTKEKTNSNPVKRTIRSYVLRAGRLSNAQRTALENLWPVFGIDKGKSKLDFASLFGNKAPVTLEIGYGMGDSLAEMAKADPQRNFVGIEVHAPGIGNLLKLIKQENLQNVRLLDDDAVQIIKNRIPDESLERVHLYFPDPWHKKRHNKRRIVQTDFVALIATKLQKNGLFHMATDWEDYAEHMVEIMQTAPDYINTTKTDSPFIERPEFRPVTKFEKRGIRLGHGVWDLIYTKR